MGEPRYLVKYDSRVGLFRWQAAPGERLLAPTFRPVRRTPRVVALGGGTGLPIVLQGLKAAFFPPGWSWVPARDCDRLTAIVTVADDGGSSGRLRQEYRVLAPGDLRNCLLALSDGDPRMAALFDFRFNGRGDVAGHSLGNLIITALSQLESDFPQAVVRAGEILGIRGRVFPSTPDDISLVAEFADGSVVEGESRVGSVHRPIRRVYVQPGGARAFPPALEALTAADLIVIGPGSLYTSLLPILLIEELAEAIARSRARVVLVMNIMTEPGETDGYTPADFVQAFRRHAPQVTIHHVLLNTPVIPGELIDRYAVDGAVPIRMDAESLRTLGCHPVERDLLGIGPKIRHDPLKLAGAILELIT